MWGVNPDPMTTMTPDLPLDLMELLPPDWRDAMKPHLDPALVAKLESFLTTEYAEATVYPPLPELFQAFRLCPLERARVLILGQDPYHQPGQAHGLCFSVRPEVKAPPSLRNIFKELSTDLGVAVPSTGDLTGWGRQGVLLLNAVLTVRAGKPGSHANQGWEHLTDAAIRALAAKPTCVVFVLWGAYARKKAHLVPGDPHVVIEAAHPSPMNARGFLGSRPFSAVNAALTESGQQPILWSDSLLDLSER